MTSRLTSVLVVLFAGSVAVPTAFAQQTINVTVGYFAVHGEDARGERDVITENRNVLVFDAGEFNGPTVGAEWLVPLGEYLEAGAGIAFSRRTVHSVYEDFVDNDGTEIDQDLRLRIVPVSFTLRVVPTGTSAAVQPYFGGGLGLFGWRYSESGEFVDLTARPRPVIFREQYAASGSATGAVVLGGIRFAGDALAGGFEIRYHDAEAALGDEFAHIVRDPRLDLGGWIYQATIGFRFGG